MKIMNKLFCVVLLSGLLLAEESGMFFGFGFGGAFGASGYSKDGVGNTTKLKTNYGYDAELLFGYKQFFIQNIGLRYYLNTDYATGMKLKGVVDGEYGEGSVNFLNAGFNVDLLFNFIVSNAIDIGVYGGGQVGFNTISGRIARAIENQYNYIVNTFTNYKASVATIFFNTSINLGARVSFFKYNALEFFVKIPMLENKAFYHKDTTKDNSEVSLYLKQPYIAGVRYVFSF